MTPDPLLAGAGSPLVLSDADPLPVAPGQQLAMATGKDIQPHIGPEVGPRNRGLRGGGPQRAEPEITPQPKEGTVIPPSSPLVQQAIARLKAWLPMQEKNGPNLAMRRNIQILERGGPIAETYAKHTLQTWGEPPGIKGLEAPTITLEP